MKIKNILYMSVGAFGSTGIIRDIRAWEGREFKIVGTDIREPGKTHGSIISDVYYQIPSYDNPNFPKSIEKIVVLENIDVCIFGHSRGLAILQKYNICPVMCSPYEVMDATANKHKTYRLLPEISPQFHYVDPKDSLEEMYKKSFDLGWPERPICMKPVKSSGGRGFYHIAPANFNKTASMFERGPQYITLEDLNEMNRPPILFMELLQGENYHIELLAKEGRVIEKFVEYRLQEVEGLGYNFAAIDNLNLFTKEAKMIASRFGLNYLCFFQMMGGKLLEVGARPAGSSPIARGFMRGAIQIFEGDEPTEAKARKPRRMLREWTPLFVY